MATTFFIEMLLNGKAVQVDSNTETFIMREHMYGDLSFILHAVFPEWKKWEALIEGVAGVKMSLRWGLNQDGKITYGAWRSADPNYVYFRYSPSALELWINGTGLGWRMTQQCSKGIFQEQRISEMVKWLATQNGLRADVTKTKGQLTRYQCEMNDAEFIRQVCLPNAVDAAGQADYRYYIKNGNTVVFGPPKISQGEDLDTFTLQTNPYSLDPNGIQVLDVEYRKIMTGSNSLELRGFDKLDKQPSLFEANWNTVKFRKLAEKKPAHSGGPSRIEHTVGPDIDFNRAVGVKERASATWSVKDEKLFRTSVTIRPRLDVEIGKTLKLVVERPKEGAAFPTGRWLIYGMMTWRSAGRGQTTLLLERRTWYG